MAASARGFVVPGAGLAALFLTLALGGCDQGASATALVDGGSVCATALDCRPSGEDFLPVDLTIADLDERDASVPADFAAPPDLVVPDLARPDLQLPDLQWPDLQSPDLQVPDLQAPDVQLPDLQLPDLQLPDLHTPDFQTPDLQTPDLIRLDLVPPPDLVPPQPRTLGFAAPVDYTVGSHPTAVAAGDLNGDGKLDIAVVNSSSTNNVGVLLNNGDGTFASPVSYSAHAAPQGIALGDFNGDGKLDVAVANGGSSDVSVLLNTGNNGTLGAATNYSIGNGNTPYQVAVGDLNGDGKVDLAIANEGSPTVGVLLNKGNGTFAAVASYNFGSDALSLAIADLDGDGKLDLAVGDYGGTMVGVLLNAGNGTFGSATGYSGGAKSPSSVALGDLDGDGVPDLVVANVLPVSGTTVGVLLNNGNGTFATPLSTTSATPWAVAIGDLDGDGVSDVATANNAGTVSVYVNKGKGSLATAVNYTVGGQPLGIALGDVNSDGRLDVIAVHYLGNYVSVLLNTSH